MNITITWGIVSISMLVSFYLYSRMIFFKTLYQKTKVETSWLKKMTESASDTLDIYDFELEKNIQSVLLMKTNLNDSHKQIKEIKEENSRLRAELKQTNKNLDKLNLRLRNLM
jgi:peptidoglycan hydrolase CwlO-like protein